MTKRSDHLVVIPAYNEAATVAAVTGRVHDLAPFCDVLVVNDGSTDATATRAREAGATVLELPFNLGIGGAVQAGFVYAKENGYRYMVQVDGDGQHDPSEIETLQGVMDSDPALDMVCGSRFLVPGEYLAPISRRTGIHVFAFLLSRIVGQRVTDPTSGFRLYNRRAIELFATDYPHDYPEVEAVLMLHTQRLRMAEVPVRMFERGGGRSSISTGKSFYYMIKVLLAIFVGMLRRRAVPRPGDPAPVAAEHGI
ncbi:glycosyltransferase family 2 protein [Solirubrobacter ginsenosidimutans]|uniref:Glycosyltransferase family 2 protein n=1 Tax=Solirubrobacter ginsenosidimutans TaxID=490573 RepID=A0A9X3S2M6_9ACTN|nr:glycosyltransferase family 2 protein [Solirubrobacter ginsenosidimutans]MDA0164760.1 glycosyltransferase family 2 protein [Solirubrobacter ginsenosidimutans]